MIYLSILWVRYQPGSHSRVPATHTEHVAQIFSDEEVLQRQ